MPRAFLALLLMLLPALPWLSSGDPAEALTADPVQECFDRLIGQKSEFEEKNPGIIIEPDFRTCTVGPYFRYVQGYEGGECFFLRIVSTEISVLIQGIGSQVQPFEDFDAAFKRDNGTEAQINFSLVTPPQCPAVTFLRSLQRDHLDAAPASLEIEQVPLRNGDPRVIGRASKWIGGFLELLVVDESGRVHNFTRQLYSGPSISFELRWETSPSPAPQPQLLLAINSTTRLDAFKFDQDGAAEDIFGRALKEARDKGLMLGISPRVFRLEGQTPPR